MNRHLCIAAVLAVFVLGVPVAWAGEPVGESAGQLFSEASARFHDALATKDKAGAKALFAEAIARWRTITEDLGIRNAKLYVDIGNACVLSGDTGRAVAAYRRAQRLDASDPAVTAGLDAARRQGGAPPPTAPTYSERALQYAGYLPRRALLGVFAGLWVAGWAALLGRLFVLPVPRRLGPALLILGALAAAPVVAAEALDSSLIHAVIVAAKAPAYNGPSDAVYQPTFKDGLPAGVEVRQLEERSGWVRVRLGSGEETWVRSSDLERI